MAPAHPRTPVPAHVAHGPTELSPASPAPAAAPDARAHTPRRSQLDRFMHTCLTVRSNPDKTMDKTSENAIYGCLNGLNGPWP